MNGAPQDGTKLGKLTRNHIGKQKKDLNDLIPAVNAENDGVKFQKIQGEFSPWDIFMETQRPKKRASMFDQSFPRSPSSHTLYLSS